ncbi:hypothetical protein F8388_016426 [Cannabis sativa]|uniref:Ubiquitin-like protease family profile domain-containing protein n=1 Tax=Cannabis sativa TaxID=3483 RepID=A0A7J6ETS3_CANSA|nr:hypothetical protein G4B88_015960 [Cannabis sativa]KAF4386174.1 hypothetical protein F8388_016426 [Cannabis sativa]
MFVEYISSFSLDVFRSIPEFFRLVLLESRPVVIAKIDVNVDFTHKFCASLMVPPFRSGNDSPLSLIIGSALERYYLEKRNRRSVAISFTEYRCPEQPDGDQCGYYSMRFIKSFMTENNPTRKLETEFKRNISSSYTNKEINEIRDEWAKRYSTKDCKINEVCSISIGEYDVIGTAHRTSPIGGRWGSVSSMGVMSKGSNISLNHL